MFDDDDYDEEHHHPSLISFMNRLRPTTESGFAKSVRKLRPLPHQLVTLLPECLLALVLNLPLLPPSNLLVLFLPLESSSRLPSKRKRRNHQG